MKNLFIGFIIMLCLSCQTQEEWRSLFNGSDLTGWTPKIKGYPVGENFGNTFRVEDGLLKVSYAEYDSFNNRFGHLFHAEEFSHYLLRLEYRFTGEQCPGGPGWAWRNSGVMIHGQDPSTMAIDQNFPVSIEVQLLGGDGTNPRNTGNLCTPGTNVVMDNELVTRHCTNADSETYHGDQWVTAILEVNGNGVIRHIINGDTVLTYSEPQLDPEDEDAQKLLDQGVPMMLEKGTISLQSESHPVEYRKVEIKRLSKD
ncbi:MAG: 3-keto-disaccharide hydrolase [Cyclobacteriaceae bacterium]